jgi:hypothetical protein
VEDILPSVSRLMWKSQSVSLVDSDDRPYWLTLRTIIRHQKLEQLRSSEAHDPVKLTLMVKNQEFGKTAEKKKKQQDR